MSEIAGVKIPTADGGTTIVRGAAAEVLAKDIAAGRQKGSILKPSAAKESGASSKDA